MQFLASGGEIPCETTAIWKVTVKPLILTTAGTIMIIVSLIDMLARIEPVWQTYLADIYMDHFIVSTLTENSIGLKR